MHVHHAAAFAIALLFGAAVARAEDLAVLAAGATESTLRDVVPTFEKESGHRITVAFGAVGKLRDRVDAGEKPDVMIVTPVIVEQLEAKGRVRPGSRVDLGEVGGGIAVRKGVPRPDVGTPKKLKRALLQAREVYYADPAIATAGQHLMKVVDRLGIGDEVRKKGRVFPGGREAMQAMARSKANAIGLTQASEILSVPEVVLVGPYPGDLQNKTTYSGVVFSGAAHADAGVAFLKFLVGPVARARFAKAGFEPPASGSSAGPPAR